MKKSLLIIFTFCCVASQAQEKLGKVDAGPRFPALLTDQKPGKDVLKKTSLSGWNDIVTGVINSSPNTNAFQAFVSFLMPDSNAVIVDPNGAKSQVFQHGSGFVFDPKDQSLLNSGGTPLSKYNAWTLDSIAFRYLYVRNVDMINGEKVVDTLVVQFLKMPALVKGDFGTGAAKEVFAKPNYSPAANLAVGQTSSIKILLTGGPNVFVQGSESDSTITTDENSWLTKAMTIPVSMLIGSSSGNPDNIAGFTFSFRPMLKPALGDTLICGLAQKPVNRYNYFGYRYIENTGGADNHVKQSTFYNNTLTLPKDTRYGATVKGWTGYIPGNAYANAQYLNFQYFLSTNTLGMHKPNAPEGYALGDAYPNPAFGEEVNIGFTLPRADNVSLAVYDVTGKKVKEITAGIFEAGTHSLSFDAGNLGAGIYMYTLTAGDYSATKKLSIIK